MPSKLHLLCIGILLIWFIPTALPAQNTTAVLSGRVLDPAGLPVPESTIRLTRQSTGAVREGVSDGLGNYRFDLLEPGDYSIRVNASGFATYEASAIHLQVAFASQLDVHLTLGTVQNEVLVQADVSPVNNESIAKERSLPKRRSERSR
jgi:hypothetical protein